ncbi:hypothetical protein [Rhizobium rhizoryzae]|jgi:hypothetical protein|uniref:hypothetical protein n=1 Tax=Rhizobium rhizoryzae TaxID=451876 RepID=UPI0028A2196C|nr:hypothetical protein [Rhizobium rhizoryzae]
MGALAPLLASLLTSDVRGFAQRTKRNVILYAIAALFALTAYGTGIAALAVYLARKIGPVTALASVAGGSLLIVLIILLAVSIKNKADEKRRREAAAGSRAMMLTAAVSALPLLVKSKPLMAAAISGGVGLIALKLLGGGNDPSDPSA